jgi:hypothetical protein
VSVFRNIMSRIFGRRAEAQPAPSAAPAPEVAMAEASSAAMPAASPGPVMAPPAQVGAPATAPAAAAPSATPAQPVDVEAVLTQMAESNPQKLNWRTSIVDLMKLLDLDSSLAARKELAEELGYSGAKDGSAEMNTWLHRAVMRKLAENGGRVPEELKS